MGTRGRTAAGMSLCAEDPNTDIVNHTQRGILNAPHLLKTATRLRSGPPRSKTSRAQRSENKPLTKRTLPPGQTEPRCRGSSIGPVGGACTPCAICLEDMRSGAEHKTVTLACSHVFHESCMLSWIDATPEDEHPMCPLCRCCVACTIEDPS